MSLEPVRLDGTPKAVSVSKLSVEGFLDERIADLERAAVARGEAAGRAAALDEFGALFAKLEAAGRDTAQHAADALAARTAQCVVAIASQVLRRELDAGRYDIERMVRETLATAATGRAPCVVRVHPSDAERLAAVPFRTGTEVQADADLSPGSVQVESAQGLVARNIDEILSQIRAALEVLEP